MTVVEPGQAGTGSNAVEVAGLNVTFRTKGWDGTRTVRAVQDVDLNIGRGRTLGVAGESGSGKSTIARALMRVTPIESGDIRIGETDVAKVGGRGLKAFRRHMQMVFQDPYDSLNPRLTVGDSVAEALGITGIRRPDQIIATRKLFDRVGLPQSFADRYPHQLSGGQRQRVSIARALAVDPTGDHLRRGGVRAGRVGPRSDSQPPEGSTGRGRPVLSVHLPRPVDAALSGGRRGDHVFRTHCRDRDPGANLFLARTSLYPGAVQRDPGTGRRPDPSAHPTRRRAAQPGLTTYGVCVSSAMPAGAGDLPSTAAGAESCSRRPARRLPFPGERPCRSGRRRPDADVRRRCSCHRSSPPTP